MRFKLLLMLAFTTFSIAITTSCQNKSSSTEGAPPRYFDRDLYFAVSDISVAGNEFRNNPAHQAIIKEALLELSRKTRLGETYFKFHDIAETQLNVVTELSDQGDSFKSFIVIYPSEVYQQFVIKNFGPSTPDPNAVLVNNAYNKRQFYIIFNADCFNGTSYCGNISLNGMYSLVFRQIGYFMGFAPVDCGVKPNAIMCNNPTDTQYNFKESFFVDFDNSLNQIDANPNFYSK